MKKFIILTFLLLGVSTYSGVAFAQTSLADEVVVDYDCQASKIFGVTPTVGSDNYEDCLVRCPRICLFKSPEYTVRIAGAYCIEDKLEVPPYKCMNLGNDPNITVIPDANFLGINIDRGLLILVRRVMLGVFGAAGLVVLAFAIVAMYKFAFSQGSQEKVQEAMKIFRSLIVGSIIIFAGLILIQVVATLSGVTGDLFDFNFLPRTGRYVFLYPDDLGRRCLTEQVALPDGEQYKCDKNTLVWIQ